MTFKIFIDSDIILDILSKRESFYDSAAILFSLIEKGPIEGYTSPIIVSNVHHVLGKRVSKDNTITSLKYFKSLLEILPVDKRSIESALNSESDDFEDAIQCFCAEQNRNNYFITRNKIDYMKAQMNILTAKEFLSMVHSLNINESPPNLFVQLFSGLIGPADHQPRVSPLFKGFAAEFLQLNYSNSLKAR